MSSLTHTIQLGAEELLLKRKELAELEKELAEKELQLSTLKCEFHQFERLYNQIVGKKYRELDEVRAQVLEMASRFYPRSDEFRGSAKNAREQARQTAGEAQDFAIDADAEQKFTPSEELKKLFREVAKKIHPDLAEDAEEQKRRHDLMSQLNLAYDRLDEEGIRAVLVEWEAGNPEKEEVPLGTQLVRVIRKVTQVRKRIEKISRQYEEMEQSEMILLMNKLECSKANGGHLLQELAANVEEKILSVKSRVRDLAAEFH